MDWIKETVEYYNLFSRFITKSTTLGSQMFYILLILFRILSYLSIHHNIINSFAISYSATRGSVGALAERYEIPSM